jgi:hypothetical protein
MVREQDDHLDYPRALPDRTTRFRVCAQGGNVVEQGFRGGDASGV